MRNKNARIPDPNKVISCPGDRFHIEYASKVNDDGTVELVESGKTDIQEYIQSFLEFTDMNYILNQLKLGDISVINQKKPMYGDFTEAPKSMAEFYQIQINAQRAFEQLPIDVRNSYDHNFYKFMSDMGSDKWKDVMKDYLPKSDDNVQETPAVSEVSADA